MPLKIIVTLLITLSFLDFPPVNASSSVRVSKVHPDTIPSHGLLLTDTRAKGQEKGFFRKLKNNFLSLIFNKHDKGKKGLSTKAALGSVSLCLIVIGLFLIVNFYSVILLGAGVVMAIVSLALPKSETDIKEKKKSNLPAIIALSVFLGVATLVAVVLSSSGKH